MWLPSQPPPRPARRTVFVAVGDPELRRSIAASLRFPNDGIVDVSSVVDLPQVRPGRTDRVVVVGPTDHRGQSTFPDVATFRARDPVTPVILCVGRRDPQVTFLPAFVRSGIDDLCLAGFDSFETELPRVVRHSLDHALPQSVVEAVVLRQAPVMRARQFWIMRRAAKDVTVEAVAGWFRVAPSTLRTQCKQDGSPTPKRWIELSRLLHVAHQLDETVFNLSIIASRLDFPSASAMSAFVHRMTDSNPSALRTEGAIARVVRRAMDLVPSSSAGPPGEVGQGP
jgi:AraC-like DNA-binding protein